MKNRTIRSKLMKVLKLKGRFWLKMLICFFSFVAVVHFALAFMVQKLKTVYIESNGTLARGMKNCVELQVGLLKNSKSFHPPMFHTLEFRSVLQNVSYLSPVPKSGYKVSDCKLLLSDEFLAVGYVRTNGETGTLEEFYNLQTKQWSFIHQPTKYLNPPLVTDKSIFYPPLVRESNFIFGASCTVSKFCL